MGSYRQQTLIEAPVDAVWAQVGDPNRYPDWAGDFVEVAGLDDVEEGARFKQTVRTPFGRLATTEFVVDQLDDMREIQVRCLMSGYYLHWLVTEAGNDTFAEIEIGMDPERLGDRAFDATLGKRWYRRVVEDTLERLRAVVA
jgi:hypothetical protein